MREWEQNPQPTTSIFSISPSLHPFYSTLIISPPAPQHSLHLLSPLGLSLHLVSPASSSFLFERQKCIHTIYLFVYFPFLFQCKAPQKVCINFILRSQDSFVFDTWISILPSLYISLFCIILFWLYVLSKHHCWTKNNTPLSNLLSNFNIT